MGQLNTPDTHAVGMGKGDATAAHPMPPMAAEPNGSLNNDPSLGAHPHIDTVAETMAPLMSNDGSAS